MGIYDNLTGKSSETIKKTTGKGWQEWCELLDSLGADKMTHKQIAQMLSDKKLIKRGWWLQTVTVGYEYARGRRVVGQTKDAGFEIGVQQTLPISVEQAWQFLLTPPGLNIWLGKVDGDFKFEKGAHYQTADGTTGEIRSLSEGKRVRLTWQPKGREQSTTLQVYLTPSGAKTSVLFHHEKLADSKERDAMRKHWGSVLGALQKTI